MKKIKQITYSFICPHCNESDTFYHKRVGKIHYKVGENCLVDWYYINSTEDEKEVFCSECNMRVEELEALEKIDTGKK